MDALPRFPHVVLGTILRVLRVGGLADRTQLEVVPLVNVAMSVASTWMVFEIGTPFAGSRRQALAAAALFGFFPALIHYDAFVLSENPTIFAVLLSLHLMIAHRQRAVALLLAGAALGCATMFWTALGLMGLPCFLYSAAPAHFAPRALLRSAGFSAGCFAVVAAAIFGVYQVSGGRLLGPSAVGGLDFFFMNCKVRQVTSTHRSPAHYTIPPSRDHDYERELFTTDRPYHDQAYFFRLGAECICENPRVLLTNLLEVRHLFFTNFFPELFPRSHPEVWRLLIRDVSQTLAFDMFASPGLIPSSTAVVPATCRSSCSSSAAWPPCC